MAVIEWIPKITYGAGPTVFTLTQSSPPWVVKNHGVGGKGIAASGIRESFVVRIDQQLKLTLRFLESEWAAIDTFLQWARANWGTSFIVQLDSGTPATAWNCYLESPSIDEDVEPSRMSNYPEQMSLDIVLTTSDSSRFTTDYHN